MIFSAELNVGREKRQTSNFQSQLLLARLYCSLDVKSPYTTCDMRKAVNIAMERLYDNPNILPPTITPEAIKFLLNLSLDNAYFEFDNRFYKQITGGQWAHH